LIVFNSLNLTAKSTITIRPSQKVGMDRPKKLNIVTA